MPLDIADRPGHALLRSYDEPPLQTNEVRVRSLFSSFKHGSEFRSFRADSADTSDRWDSALRLHRRGETAADSFPKGLGNMCMAEVAEVGEEVQNLKVGDRVFGHMTARDTHTMPAAGLRIARIPDWWRVQKRIPDSNNQHFFESTCGLSLVWMKYGGTANNLASEESSFNLLSLDTALTGIDSVMVRNIQVSGVNNRVGTVFLVLLGIWLVAGSVLIKREKVKELARKNLSQSREMAQKSGTQAPKLEWLVIRNDIVG